MSLFCHPCICFVYKHFGFASSVSKILPGRIAKHEITAISVSYINWFTVFTGKQNICRHWAVWLII